MQKPAESTDRVLFKLTREFSNVAEYKINLFFYMPVSSSTLDRMKGEGQVGVGVGS